MPEIDELLARLFEAQSLTRAVLSKPARRELPRKVAIDPVELGGQLVYRFTTHLPDRTTHENLAAPDAHDRVILLLSDYRQALLQSPEADWQVLGTSILRRAPSRPTASHAHDRRKRYLLEEGTPVPYLVELGVMTAGGHVRKSHYGKFRQVNRFLELVEDVMPVLPDGRLSVVDFGSGKSYLTFALHHLLTEVHGREVELVGLDLKEDVVATCRALARRIDATGLRFEHGDIAAFETRAFETPAFGTRAFETPAFETGGKVDLVVSLHACDTATDEALAQAVRWRADAILAVPCCQQEAYGQISSTLLQPLLRHGLAKERLAAIATDSLRAQLLELAGYRTQLVDFVALEHTPKNVLIRAVKGRPAGAEARAAYEQLRDALGLEPALERLLSAA